MYLHVPWLRVATAPLQELAGGLHDANAFGDGGHDELILVESSNASARAHADSAVEHIPYFD
jgi:hypothetical protein